MKRTQIFINFVLVLVLWGLGGGSTCLFSKVRVGEEVIKGYETPHPYPGGKGEVWKQEFYSPNAGYVAVHFVDFNLAPGDYVEVSSPDGKYSYRYITKGKFVKGGTEQSGVFWATHILGDKAIVKLFSRNKAGGWGIKIDKWAHGYKTKHIKELIKDLDEAVGNNGKDSFKEGQWAQCYKGTELYDKSRAVSRLLINGIFACTGWLLGSEGHLLTTNQCIENQSEADNTDYEFMAEGASCEKVCSNWGACASIVEADSGKLVKTNPVLDYSLILLPVNLVSRYGYLQMRDVPPAPEEYLCITRYPGAKEKQLVLNISIDSGYRIVPDPYEMPYLCGSSDTDKNVYTDYTEAGSPGSPVLGCKDKLVVALHHCADKSYEGASVLPIIADLGPLLPANALADSALPESEKNLTSSQTAAFCQYPSSLGSSQFYEWIARVKVGNLDNSSGPSGYSNFTNFTADLIAGTTVPVSLTPGYSDYAYTEYWKIWIDYNQNCNFNEPGENVFSGSGTGIISGSFVVPISALPGKTWMRVSMRYNAYPPVYGSFDYGEVEDYSVSIYKVPAADFTANRTDILVYDTVTFTDLSTNYPTAWLWTFGAGCNPTSSTSKNPIVGYNTIGRFPVTLSASNIAGSNTITKNNYITVYCRLSGTDQYFGYIANVNVGSLNNTSGASGYSDFTNVTGEIRRGQAFNIGLTPGFLSDRSNNVYWKVWIDYNRNCVFEEPGERAFSGSGSGTVRGSSVVPLGIGLGLTRMRVAVRQDALPQPCGTYNFGEVEDYLINILTGAPVCSFSTTASCDLDNPSECYIVIGSTVYFHDTSANNPTSWHWQIYNGSAQPVIIDGTPTASAYFGKLGVFSTCLTVTNSAGSSTTCKRITVDRYVH